MKAPYETIPIAPYHSFHSFRFNPSAAQHGVRDWGGRSQSRNAGFVAAIRIEDCLHANSP
jgi:hypothetical protein